jgi:hypothetical protein
LVPLPKSLFPVKVIRKIEKSAVTCLVAWYSAGRLLRFGGFAH